MRELPKVYPGPGNPFPFQRPAGHTMTHAVVDLQRYLYAAIAAEPRIL